MVPGEVLSGRLAVRVESQPVRAVSSGFELAGNDREGWLRLNGPLGATVAQARWDGQGVTLITSDGERQFADLGALSRGALGEELPLQALPDWLRGRPWPGATSSSRSGPDPGFEQLGWTVDLKAFDRGALVASRSSPPAATLRVLLER